MPSNQTYIVDTSKSPYSRLHPVPASAVTLNDAFWSPRRQINREVVIPGQYKLCEETGRIDNFRYASGRLPGEFKGMFFNDSDVYKLIEAAAWALVGHPDEKLDQLIDGIIDEIAAAQRPDGYINTYFTSERTDQRWTNFDLHEMYCAGHLFQAAVAHYRATGKTSLLDVSTRFADYICSYFGPEDQGKHFGTDGHPEIEMALVELYRVTGDEKYIHQAKYFVDARGSGRLGRPFGDRESSYHQDHIPFRQLNRLDGHSVRAVYLNCGAADLVLETGEQTLSQALERMWDSMTARQMYVHGGLGSRYEIEGFGDDYELPNNRAHAETCASVGNFMWNWRMLLLEGQSRFADIMELTLYNSVLSGISLDGRGYFYQNPLSDEGNHRRQRWFTVACCPANVSRLLAQLPGYVYSVSDNAVWVHLYVSNSAVLTLPDGSNVNLVQKTEYPWEGDIHITVESAAHFKLHLRLPGWCTGLWRLTVNHQPVDASVSPEGYLVLERDWHAGDQVRLELPMPVERLESHPFVSENQGDTALMRGPMLYCVEAADNPQVDVRAIVLPENADFTTEFVPDLLNGVVVLRTQAKVRDMDTGWQERLYRHHRPGVSSSSWRDAPITVIPYCVWANRESGPMRVWLPIR